MAERTDLCQGLPPHLEAKLTSLSRTRARSAGNKAGQNRYSPSFLGTGWKAVLAQVVFGCLQISAQRSSPFPRRSGHPHGLGGRRCTSALNASGQRFSSAGSLGLSTSTSCCDLHGGPYPTMIGHFVCLMPPLLGGDEPLLPSLQRDIYAKHWTMTANFRSCASPGGSRARPVVNISPICVILLMMP